MRPLIALSSRFTETAQSWRVPATALGVPYQHAILRAGGQPIAVSPLVADDLTADDIADSVVSRVDGVCIPGGPDVDPHRYGATSVHPTVFGVRSEHDDLDIALVRSALSLGKPILAICRGHQVLNVALGGTLHQHLPDVIGDEPAAQHVLHHHHIDLIAGSKVAAIMGSRSPRCHCVHHQAVDVPGRDLVVTAWAGDVIEGLEMPDRWVVGVQWHPEDDAAHDERQQSLFDAFVSAARNHALVP